MTTRKACDVCGMYKQRLDGQPGVVRYTLRREVDQKRTNGHRLRRVQQSAGGLDLCDECWGRMAKPNMNPNKANHHKRETDGDDRRPLP